MKKTVGHLNASVLVIHLFIQHLLWRCWVNFPLHSCMLICQLLHETFLKLLIQKRIFLHSVLPYSVIFLALHDTLYFYFLACYMFSSYQNISYLKPEVLLVLFTAVFPKYWTMYMVGSFMYICMMIDWINYITKYQLHARYYAEAVKSKMTIIWFVKEFIYMGTLDANTHWNAVWQLVKENCTQCFEHSVEDVSARPVKIDWEDPQKNHLYWDLIDQ